MRPLALLLLALALSGCAAPAGVEGMERADVGLGTINGTTFAFDTFDATITVKAVGRLVAWTGVNVTSDATVGLRGGDRAAFTPLVAGDRIPAASLVEGPVSRGQFIALCGPPTGEAVSVRLIAVVEGGRTASVGARFAQMPGCP